nr:MAG TPA: hypothetical protein [Caudoviricetes sp.]
MICQKFFLTKRYAQAYSIQISRNLYIWYSQYFAYDVYRDLAVGYQAFYGLSKAEHLYFVCNNSTVVIFQQLKDLAFSISKFHVPELLKWISLNPHI